MKYIKLDDLQSYCDNQKDHSITPNEFQRMNHYEFGWHTGTPTEEGQYFVAYRWGLDNQIMHDMAKQICYGATTFYHGTWKVEFPFVVLAWQRIEPFEEK